MIFKLISPYFKEDDSENNIEHDELLWLLNAWQLFYMD